MEVSLKPEIKLRSRIARIATAVGVALVIGSFGVGSVRAAEGNHGGGHGGGGHGSVQHGGGGYHGGYHGGGGGYGGPTVVDNYYAPAPDYYASPEPYGYYGPGPEYGEAPPQGVSLFFGL
jgi:hypothetical protein